MVYTGNGKKGLRNIPKNYRLLTEQKIRRKNNMNMKKIVALLLAVVMVLGLAACGGKEAASSSKLKIGMVTDVGGVNDQSFNQGAWEGLQRLAKEDATFEVNYLESKTDADYASNIQTFIDEKYDLIISVGFMLAGATREAAQANPDQKFAIIDDDTNADLPNVACLMFAQEQCSYLVGVIAGTMTKTGTVGYVQGMVSDSMNLFGIGFVSGVLAANPNATVLQYNANSFGDAAVGSAAATDMFTKGADIIYHAAGGTGNGVINACADNGIYAIGVDYDQSFIAPETVISSAMKRVDNGVQDICKALKDGKFAGGVRKYSLTDGGVDIAPTTTLLTPEALAAVEQAKKDILDGKVTVPTTQDACPDFILK